MKTINIRVFAPSLSILKTSHGCTNKYQTAHKKTFVH